MKRATQQVGTVLVFILFLFPFTGEAFSNRIPEVQVIDVATREVELSFLAFDEEYVGGMEVVVGDVDGDGTKEYVVAQSGGKDADGWIRVFSAKGKKLYETQIISSSLNQSEMDIAIGDVDTDGSDEIIVSFPYWNRPLVLILDGRLQLDTHTARFFNAFADVTTGVVVTVGDVTGDGQMEIIAGSGEGASPRVRVFNSKGQLLMPDIVPFEEEATQGLSLATVDTNGDNVDELVIGFQNGAETRVKNYVIDAAHTYPVLAEFSAFTREFKSGVQLDGIDLDGDGTQEIAIVPAGDQIAEVRFFRGDGEKLAYTPLSLFEEDFRGGAHVSVAQLDEDVAAELVVSPRRQRQKGDMERENKYIEVDLSEQIEYVWEDGYMRNVYLVSTGLPGTPTPPGEYSVLKKIASHVYDGRPEYFFPNTPWNLRFIQGATGKNFYLHTAYWHNNFGRPQSHGCVNMREADAHFVYDWADIGTPVWVHD